MKTIAMLAVAALSVGAWYGGPAGLCQKHTVLVCREDGRFFDDGYDAFPEEAAPELAAYCRSVGMIAGQEFRIFKGPEVWFMTRGYIRQTIQIPAGSHTLSVEINAARDGYVPPGAYAICRAGFAAHPDGTRPDGMNYYYYLPADIGMEAFSLSGETPTVFSRQIPVIGPAYVVVSVSTESVGQRDIWPSGQRHPFAVQLALHVQID